MLYSVSTVGTGPLGLARASYVLDSPGRIPTAVAVSSSQLFRAIKVRGHLVDSRRS